ncbi:histidinol-phosphate transaminase [Marinilongibacter aquaticus]|uniref:histidinol-phosphate transaminase n=1 Tax=Marinilongibacter aquaticus TaxID=2975157 RepID=UPI0021BDE62C|nr:histidinol-phosphate transaminase [Marinilongibacter aquaticus]UBM59609.1 histidinol-phosphate transaminase [Marinilongibacter aquaticus]
MSIYQKLVRKHLLDLKPYSSARDEYSGKEGVFLDANENPFGSVSGKNLNRYPDPYQWEIKSKLAELKGCKAENIFLGNGSDEAIDLLIKSLCEPKEEQILILPPTYGMYQVCADIQQVEVLKSNLTADFQLDLEDIDAKVGEKTKMIWICSPNNPTGNLIDSDSIKTLLEKYKEIVFVIDEAYIDFTKQASFIGLLDRYENLVVIQTFSKAWGLAGLRVGMAFAHVDLIKILNKIKYPYNLNLQSQRLILEALDNVAQKETYVDLILQERENLKAGLLPLPIVEHIYPSDSNQLLVRFKAAKSIFQTLLENKVIVRDRTNVVLCDDCLRISIGTESENQRLLEALKEIAERMK